MIEILIDGRFVFDAFGSMGELERGETLLESLWGGRYHGEHGGFAVASETVGKKSGEDRVSVRNVFLVFVLGESGDDHAETAETEVDFFALSESFSFGSGDSDSLGSG